MPTGVQFQDPKQMEEDKMNKFPQILVISWLVMSISACQSVGVNPAQSIVGSWKSEIGGFPVMVEYMDQLVRIKGYDDVPYQIENNSLVVAGVTRTLAFPAKDVMIQTDPLTSAELKFERVNPGQ